MNFLPDGGLTLAVPSGQEYKITVNHPVGSDVPSRQEYTITANPGGGGVVRVHPPVMANPKVSLIWPWATDRLVGS